jgi:hypothetical protein
MPDKKVVDQAFRKDVISEARGKGVEWRVKRRLWWHRTLTELRDDIERRIGYIKGLILRDFRSLDVDEDRDGEILGWTEDTIMLYSEADARRFQRVVRNVLGPDWSEQAVSTETKTIYHVSTKLRTYLKENRTIRKEVMRRMNIRPVLKTKRRVTRAIKNKPRRGDKSTSM